MRRPVVVLAEPMYHPSGQAMLQEQCDLRVLVSPTPAQVAQATLDADALIVRYPHRVDAGLLASSPGLVIVGCSGRGTDAIDIDAATRHGVAVINNPGHGRRPVSEGAILLMLALAKRLPVLDARMRAGRGWRQRDFAEFLEVDGSTLGVVGLGEVGTETARKAIAAFNMQVLVYDPHVAPERATALGARHVASLDELLEASDIVSLHPELNDQTRGMIGEPQLRRMKPTAMLINTSRGKVVQEQALLRALREDWIAGAALDVYENEPMGPDHPYYTMENVILMPHVAGLTAQAVQGMSQSAATQVLQALAGERPAHILNPVIWQQAAARARSAGYSLGGNTR